MSKMLTTKDKLYKAIFEDEEMSMYEYNCATIAGYESLYILYDLLCDFLKEEDGKEQAEELFKDVQASLVKNKSLKSFINIKAQRVFNLIRLNAPKVIIDNEYHKFFDYVVKAMKIEDISEEYYGDEEYEEEN